MITQSRVKKVTRLNNTRVGNPMYSVETADGYLFKTPANAGWVYAFNWHSLENKLVYIQAHCPRKNWVIHELRVEG